MSFNQDRNVLLKFLHNFGKKTFLYCNLDEIRIKCSRSLQRMLGTPFRVSDSQSISTSKKILKLVDYINWVNEF